MKDDAGLVIVSWPVGSDHRVATADGAAGSDEDVEDVQTPGLTIPHHQLLYGVEPLLEGDDHTNAVGELGPPGGDDPGVLAVHHSPLQDGHRQALGDDDSQVSTEARPDLLLEQRGLSEASNQEEMRDATDIGFGQN